MYAGHVAAGLALQAVSAKRVPAWVPLVGIGFLDILDGAFVAAGVGRVSPRPEVPLGISLDYIDWDHSLVTALAWSLVFGVAVGARYGRAALGVGAAAVFSHFVLDVLMHDGDMALWPGSEVHLGLYLWSLFPVGSWFIEGAVAAALAALAVRWWRDAGASWRAIRAPLALLAVLHVSFLPAIAPLHLAGANLEGRALAWTYAALVIAGFTLPAVLLARLGPRTSRAAVE